MSKYSDVKIPESVTPSGWGKTAMTTTKFSSSLLYTNPTSDYVRLITRNYIMVSFVVQLTTQFVMSHVYNGCQCGYVVVYLLHGFKNILI